MANRTFYKVVCYKKDCLTGLFKFSKLDNKVMGNVYGEMCYSYYYSYLLFQVNEKME